MEFLPAFLPLVRKTFSVECHSFSPERKSIGLEQKPFSTERKSFKLVCIPIWG